MSTEYHERLKQIRTAREEGALRRQVKGLEPITSSYRRDTEVDSGLLSGEDSKKSGGALMRRLAKQEESLDEDFVDRILKRVYENNEQLKSMMNQTSSGVSKINPKAAASLEGDTAFMTRLNQMTKKYPGLSKEEIFNVIQGESGFDPKAKNKSGATGLFQIMPDVAAELGFSTDEIINMAPAEQLAVYDAYLDRWDYDGSYGLGILQAAPAYRNASSNTEIYKKGTAAWKQNPGWRDKDGRITKRSIEAYYGRTE